MTYDEELLPAVSIAMEEPPKEEPLAQWLNSLFAKTDDLMVMVARPAYRFLSKTDLLEALQIDEGDILTMAAIATRFQVAASNIEARDEQTKFRVIRNG